MDDFMDVPYHSIPYAAVFWSYIILALVATALTLDSIIRPIRLTSRTVKSPKSAQSPFAIPVFTCLALTSFSLLSINMLSVLILSYRSWCDTRHIPVPACIFGTNCLFGSRHEPLLLWEWSTTSTLFSDFGQALVQSRGGWAWSNAALAITLADVRWISSSGRRVQTPRLWAFLALAEILPISFTQLMFQLYLLRSESVPSKSPPLRWSTLHLLAALGYLACMRAAPSTGENLIYLILLARLLLAIPFLCPVDSGSPVVGQPLVDLIGPYWDFIFVFALISPVVVAVQSDGISSVMSAINEHPAISAFGHDALIGGAGWVFWLTLASKSAKPKEMTQGTTISSKKEGDARSNPGAKKHKRKSVAKPR